MLFALLMTVTAWAQPKSVTYYDPVSKTNKTVTAAQMNEKTLTSGWYYYAPDDGKHQTYTIDGTVNLILVDHACLSIQNIKVTEGNTFNIYAQSINYDEMGKITNQYYLNGLDYSTAAIGGGENESCGTINIYGGIIHAMLKKYCKAAAIGGGCQGGGGTISIYGGEVTVIAGDGGAGIGSGYFYEATTNTGTVNIYGGTVNASGGRYGTAGIGGGYCASGGTINISGGTVTATGGQSGNMAGAGIGGGSECSGGNITISGTANVTATGGNYAAGIGGGHSGGSGTILIKGGTVSATGGESGAAIGGGKNASGTSITISGGVVNAKGGSGAVAIGGGYNGSGGDITISGGQVTIEGGGKAAAIGYYGNSSSLTANITLGWTNATDFIDNLSHSSWGTVTLSKAFVKHNALTKAVTTSNWKEQKIVPAYSVATNATTHGTLGISVTLAGAGANITVSPSPATNYIVNTVQYNDGSNHTITPSGNTYAFTMPSHNVSVSATFVVNPALYFGTGNDGSKTKPYTISDADGWNFFCDCLEDVDTWNYFIGKNVKLKNDITISRMAGSDKHDFSGNFDGAGHKMTVNISGTSNHIAPFFYLKPQGDNASVTIQNLKVEGTINAGAKYAGGIFGGCEGTVNIINCVSDVTINSSISGDGTHGGLVGRTTGSGTLNIEGCAFTGKLLTSNGTIKCGGLLGWKSGTGSLNISNSLYAPAEIENGETEVSAEESATFARNGGSFSNSYYTRTLGTEQGAHAYSTATLPLNIGAEVKDYGFVKAYANGVKFNDLYYMVPEAVSLANAEENDVEGKDGYFANVTLTGRTLTKDNAWNTLCLPFSLSAGQIEASPLAGAVIREMDSSTNLSSNGVLTLNFKDAESIEAGKAYIVKWTTTGENITEPVFNAVSIENADLTGTESTDGNVKFVGQYSPFAIDESNINSILFIGSSNKIGYSKNPRQLKSCRAHFWVRPNGDTASARSISVDFGDGVTTSINLVEADDANTANTADGIYTIDGRRVKGEMMQKGVYVVKGKKVVK